MDREDWLYLGGAILMGGGAAFYSAPAGAIVVGLMAAIPPLLSLLNANRKGPPK
jgi:hypothetical protein